MTTLEEDLANVMARAKQEILHLRNEVSARDDLLAFLRKEIVRQTTLNGDLQRGWARDNELLNALPQRLDDLRQDLASKDALVADLQSQVTELHKEIADAPVNQALVDELVTEIADCNQKLAMYAEDNTYKSKRITELFNQLQLVGSS